jgi:hypothetical protein
MPKSSAADNDYLKLIFNGTAIPNIADNAAVSPVTILYVALHTADPGIGGTQSTNEISYTGYLRASTARSTSGWTVTGNSVSPVVAITWNAMTGGAGGTATFWSVGVAVSGATKIIHYGAIAPTIAVSNGVTPQLTTASAVTET